MKRSYIWIIVVLLVAAELIYDSAKIFGWLETSPKVAEYERPQGRGVKTASEGLNWIKSDLAGKDRMEAIKALSRALQIQQVKEMRTIAVALWRRDTEAYPSFAWPILESVGVRVRLALLLLDIESNGYAMEVERQEILDYVRQSMTDVDIVSRRYGALTLGAHGDPADVELLLELALSDDPNGFRDAIWALGYSCREETLFALIRLERKIEDPDQIIQIGHTKDRIVEGMKDGTDCRGMELPHRPSPESTPAG